MPCCNRPAGVYSCLSAARSGGLILVLGTATHSTFTEHTAICTHMGGKFADMQWRRSCLGASAKKLRELVRVCLREDSAVPVERQTPACQIDWLMASSWPLYPRQATMKRVRAGTVRAGWSDACHLMRLCRARFLDCALWLLPQPLCFSFPVLRRQGQRAGASMQIAQALQTATTIHDPGHKLVTRST
jgi:hypothetical protein